MMEYIAPLVVVFSSEIAGSNVSRHAHTLYPQPEDYDALGYKAQGRGVLIITSSEEKGLEESGIQKLQCNSSHVLFQPGESIYLESPSFGSSEKQYSPGESCEWQIKGNDSNCVPQIKCDKVDLRQVKDELLEVTDFTGGKVELKGADHFHEWKVTGGNTLRVRFQASSAQKFRRHYDGFRCKVTCYPACKPRLDRDLCISFNATRKNCKSPISSTYDCESDSDVTLYVNSSTNCGEFSEVSVPLTPKTKKSIKLVFDAKSVKPVVDFYLLMDASGTFSDDIIVVAMLAPKLVEMRKHSPNGYFGFGTFDNKEINRRKNANKEFSYKIGQAPYIDGNGEIHRGFSFRNNFPFKKLVEVDGKSLSDVIERSARKDSTINRGHPEDLLSGIHQASFCGPIGWRSYSKKIMLVLTDDVGYDTESSAQYGREPGVKKFNKKKCYLKNGFFSGIGVDYPTLDQVTETVMENQISVIFAMSTAIYPSFNPIRYQEAITKMKMSVTELTRDSSNIIQVLHKQYEVLSKNRSLPLFVLADNEGFQDLNINTINPFDNRTSSTIECPPEKDGKVECTVDIELVDCPKNQASKMNKVVGFQIQGYENKIYLNLKYVC